MPWHPPCALYNLIVILRPIRKIRNWFSTRCFSIWICSFQGTSPRILSIPGNDTDSKNEQLSDQFLQLDFLSPSAVQSIDLELSSGISAITLLPRKEVIQPHLPIRLPCYDFTPVIGLTFDGVLLAVRLPASGAPNSHGVTGGVYKARERIHRGMLIRDY